ncbi:unnamed protein product [Closterium sp. Naga37s-1]|nr:unnamed protein product [Closterium sp. Naga37s-1]
MMACPPLRRSALRLEVEGEGEDQTCQEIRLTQDRIDALMDTSLLSLTVFFGQHSTAALLEANDADFKASPPTPPLPSHSLSPCTPPLSISAFFSPLYSFPLSLLPMLSPLSHPSLHPFHAPLPARQAELSGLVGMDVWGAGKARSKEAVKVLQTRVGEMRAGLAARREAVKKLERMLGADRGGWRGVQVECIFFNACNVLVI